MKNLPKRIPTHRLWYHFQNCQITIKFIQSPDSKSVYAKAIDKDKHVWKTRKVTLTPEDELINSMARVSQETIITAMQTKCMHLLYHSLVKKKVIPEITPN